MQSGDVHRAYFLPSECVHRIRECLQIIMDSAERNHNDLVVKQVLIINEAIDQRST